MKYKVSELEGALLDRAVAKAIGRPYRYHQSAYSNDWSIAGPLIEEWNISVTIRFSDEQEIPLWDAWFDNEVISGTPDNTGSTPLVAAMRTLVSAQFGEEVEL